MSRNVRVQVLGATRLARVVVPYLLERRGARVLAIDPGDEDEARPWFAPVRGLARDNGIALGVREDADLVIDVDPDARPTSPRGVGLRVLAPEGAASPDVNRMLLGGGAWAMGVTDGAGLWGSRPLVREEGDAAVNLLDRATLAGLEALDAAWETMFAPDGSLLPPQEPLSRPLRGGRFRPAEAFVNWELPAATIVARVRACAGPWGGARTHIGETVVWLEDAEVCAPQTPEGWAPGTLVEVDRDLVVATGRGLVRIRSLRPAWRPPRSAGAFATESGLGPGYLLA